MRPHVTQSWERRRLACLVAGVAEFDAAPDALSRSAESAAAGAPQDGASVPSAARQARRLPDSI